jgi:hypothetical protein
MTVIKNPNTDGVFQDKAKTPAQKSVGPTRNYGRSAYDNAPSGGKRLQGKMIEPGERNLSRRYKQATVGGGKTKVDVEPETIESPLFGDGPDRPQATPPHLRPNEALRAVLQKIRERKKRMMMISFYGDDGDSSGETFPTAINLARESVSPEALEKRRNRILERMQFRNEIRAMGFQRKAQRVIGLMKESIRNKTAKITKAPMAHSLLYRAIFREDKYENDDRDESCATLPENHEGLKEVLHEIMISKIEDRMSAALDKRR